MKRAFASFLAASLLLGLAAMPDGHAEQRPAQVAEMQLSMLRKALFFYRARYGEWPATLERLTEPKIKILAGIDADPWGQPFLWLRPGATDSAGCLMSVGPDGRAATKDDVQDVCDLEILNQHLVLRAGLDAATKRRDAYGRPIRLIDRDGHRLAWSYGPDGTPDTSDDVMARVRAD